MLKPLLTSSLYAVRCVKPADMWLSLMSPTVTVRVEVPTKGGCPESRMAIGRRYSFCSSLSRVASDDTTATPRPLSPSKYRNQYNSVSIVPSQ